MQVNRRTMKTLTREELSRLVSNGSIFIPAVIWINGQRLIWDYELKRWLPDGEELIGDEVLIISK